MNPEQPAPLDSFTIGFIDVGVMGEPMCRHLTEKGQAQVLVYDKAEDALSRLEKAGARRSDTATIATQANVIFMSLPSGAVVQQVVTGDNGLIHQLHAE